MSFSVFAEFAEWTGYFVWACVAAASLIVGFGLFMEWLIREVGIRRDILQAAHRIYKERAAKRRESDGDTAA